MELAGLTDQCFVSCLAFLPATQPALPNELLRSRQPHGKAHLLEYELSIPRISTRDVVWSFGVSFPPFASVVPP
jgi:hypothetical protein